MDSYTYSQSDLLLDYNGTCAEDVNSAQLTAATSQRYPDNHERLIEFEGSISAEQDGAGDTRLENLTIDDMMCITQPPADYGSFKEDDYQEPWIDCLSISKPQCDIGETVAPNIEDFTERSVPDLEVKCKNDARGIPECHEDSETASNEASLGIAEDVTEQISVDATEISSFFLTSENLSPSGAYPESLENPLCAESPTVEPMIMPLDKTSDGDSHNNSSATDSISGFRVKDLIFWRDVQSSSVVFSVGLMLLLSISCYSFITIFASLALLPAFFITSLVFLDRVATACQQQTFGYPFKLFLDADLNISPDNAHAKLEDILKSANDVLVRIRNLYLGQNVSASVGFFFALYVLLHVGRCFSLLALLTVTWVLAFSIPPFTLLYKKETDMIVVKAKSLIRILKGCKAADVGS